MARGREPKPGHMARGREPKPRLWTALDLRQAPLAGKMTSGADIWTRSPSYSPHRQRFCTDPTCCSEVVCIFPGRIVVSALALMVSLCCMDDPPYSDEPYESTADSAVRRGHDERREAVNPADNPAPSSPEADDDAVRKAAEVLERVKPY